QQLVTEISCKLQAPSSKLQASSTSSSKLQAPGSKQSNRRPEDRLDGVVELLYRQRSYFWVGIYVVAGDRLVQQSFRGPKPLWHAFAAGQANVGTVWQSGKMKVV